MTNKEGEKYSIDNTPAWAKIAIGVISAIVISIITLSYEATTQLAIMQADVNHAKASMLSTSERLFRLENNSLKSEDMMRLKTWTELKLQPLATEVHHNKADLEMIRKVLDEKH